MNKSKSSCRLSVLCEDDEEEDEEVRWYFEGGSPSLVFSLSVATLCRTFARSFLILNNSLDMLLERNVSAIKNVSAVDSSFDTLSCCR